MSRFVPALILSSLCLGLGCSERPKHPPEKSAHQEAGHSSSAHSEPGHSEAHSEHAHGATEKPQAAMPEAHQHRVSFASPANGATLRSPVQVHMHVEGMQLKPAGDLSENTGHHHLIIDGEAISEGQVVPADDKHKHFGKGQTHTEIELSPGKHTLTLQFADGAHRSYGPNMSSSIEVMVEAGEPVQGTVDFAELKDGATVSSPLIVQMQIQGLAVKPAGELAEGTGHHHLIIDGGPIPEGQVVPADDTHKHFGKGQTRTEIELSPGKHRLTLQFADGAHRSYGPRLSKTITVMVN